MDYIRKETVMKKYTLTILTGIMIFALSSCGQTVENNIAAEPVTPPENSTLMVENIESETPPSSSEELLDLFINGSIAVTGSDNFTASFYITDLDRNTEEWGSYSVGEKTDLDNDGENELIICGPYGGIYIDARNNDVYTFAAGDGTANSLSYTYYNGDVWILYSNSMNVGYEAYHMEKYEGADNLVAEINFSQELIDGNNPESGMKYLLNGTEISYDKYTAFCSKIFAAEVSTY